MSTPSRAPVLTVTAIVAMAVVAYLAVASPLPRAGVVLVAGAGLGTVCWRTASRRSGATRRLWMVATAAVTSAVAADAAFHVIAAFTSGGAMPSPLHLLYLPSHVLLGATLLLVVRITHDRVRTPLLDAGIIAASLSTVAIFAARGTTIDAFTSSPLGRTLTVLFGSLVLVTVLAQIRLAFTLCRRNRSRDLLFAAGLVHLGLTIGSMTAATSGVGDAQVIISTGWLVVAGLIALGAEHPSAMRLPLSGEAREASGPSHRVTLLVPAILLVPTAILLLGRTTDLLVLAVATTVVLALIGLRVWLLLAEAEAARERDLAHQTRADRRRLEALVSHASDVVLLIHRDRGLSFANPSAYHLFGEDPTGWSLLTMARRIHREERREVLNAFSEGLRGDSAAPIRLRTRLTIPGHDDHHVEVTAIDLRDDPHVGGVALTLREVTEQAALERRLHHQANHDHLTGLGNRQQFHDRLSHAIERTRRNEGRLALIVCDLDDFKDVNDTLGHAFGDRMLIAFADRLRNASRASDTIVRLGGDEFAILCEDVGSTRDAVRAARRLLDTTKQPLHVDGRWLDVTMSIGVVTDTGHRSAEELLRDADVALYTAKGDGKRRLALHRTTMTEATQARLRMADDLKLAIDQRALKVAFQPIVELASGRVVGLEALARWNHPTRGPVSPAEFVPVAEQAGLIPAIGDLVLNRSLEALTGWRRALDGIGLYVAVNLSARELREADAVARITGALRRYGVAPHDVVLELTESAMLEDEQLALEVMHQLHDHGIRFAVDDFGTGYSSLSYLRRLPVDIVKIDRSFVEELGVDDTADDLVRAIIELSRTLHLDVVAEGIETPAQQSILESMGCRLAQGYLLGRPADERAIHELLAGMPATLNGHAVQGGIAPR